MHVTRISSSTLILISVLFFAPQEVKSQQPSAPPTPTPSAGVQRPVQTPDKTESDGDANKSAVFATIDLEFQIASKRSEIGDLLKLDALIDSFLKNKDSIKQTVDHAVDHAKVLDCSKDFAQLSDDYDNVSKAVSYYWPITSELQKAEGQTFAPILGNFFVASTGDKCKLLQVEAQHKTVDAAITQLEQVMRSHRSKLADLRAELFSLQDKLQKLLSSQGAIRVAENLPMLILIIAGASIAIILVVRLFPVELQMEWIASGQVIQFTTVMILLSALMALGLTGILKEQVLGTLLGGIAGYVLAQGVGRATARATLNASNAANAANATPLSSAAAAAAAGAAAAAVPIAAAASGRATEIATHPSNPAP
jgi:hypothetical protein